MLTITGSYLRVAGIISILILAVSLFTRLITVPTHQVSFIGSGLKHSGVYIMDINRHVIVHAIREPIISRQTDLTWSPDFNTLVFRAVQNITIDLYALDVQNESYHQITGTGKNNHSPAFSPNGHWLAFTSERDGNSEIYIVDATCVQSNNRCRDEDARRLTNNPTADDQAAWSPDSMQIVFQSNRDGNFEIYTMNRDGSDQHRLTDSPRRDLIPNWSPDGRQIIFMSERDINAELYVMNTDGSNQRRLTISPEFEFTPQWSPDGRQILFQRTVHGSDFETFIMDADGSHIERLTTVRMFLQSPMWRS